MEEKDSLAPVESPRDDLRLSTSSDHAVHERISQLQEKVFGNTLILKEIIRHSLSQLVDTDFHNNQTRLSSYPARNLRLVNSAFWNETSETFFRSKKPLFAFTMFHPIVTISNVTYGDPYTINTRSENGVKYLDFLSSLLEGSMENPPPPFSLTFIIYEPFKCSIDVWYLQNVFNQKALTSSLAKLTIDNQICSSNDNAYCPEVPSNLRLPCLQEVNLKGRNFKPSSANFKLLRFLNSILDAALTLKKLTISLDISDGYDFIKWSLPSSLIHLTIDSKSILKRLTTTHQSNSTTYISFPGLKTLEVHGNTSNTNVTPDIPIMIKFISTMAKLQKLKLCQISEHDFTNAWCHPELKTWPNVETLEFEKLGHIPQEKMSYIQQNFPSLIHFTFDFHAAGPVNPDWISGIRYVFQEMTQLKSLKLSMRYLEYAQEFIMDSIFLGTTQEEATQLRQDPSLLDNFVKQSSQVGEGQGVNNEQRRGGIKNLLHLKSLCLDCSLFYNPYGSLPYDARPPNPPIISPLVFRLGIMELPKLDHLTLKGGFINGNQLIAQEWLMQSNDRKKSLKIDATQ